MTDQPLHQHGLRVAGRFAFALLRWPSGDLTVLFARGGQMVHVETFGGEKRAWRKSDDRFDLLADTAVLLGAEELEVDHATLLELSTLDPAMKSPAKKLLKRLTTDD